MGSAMVPEVSYHWDSLSQTIYDKIIAVTGGIEENAYSRPVPERAKFRCAWLLSMRK